MRDKFSIEFFTNRGFCFLNSINLSTTPSRTDNLSSGTQAKDFFLSAILKLLGSKTWNCNEFVPKDFIKVTESSNSSKF